MNFFEYLFCRLYWWNTKIIKEKDIPSFYSIIGISVFQTYTIVPLFCVLYVFIYDSFYIKDILTLSPFFIINTVMAFIDYFYFNRRQSELYKQFVKIPQQNKRRKDLLCILYIISIIIINVLFFIYFRSKNVS